MPCPGFDLAEQPLERPRDRGEKTVFLLPAGKRRRRFRRRCCVGLPRLQSTEQEERDEEQDPAQQQSGNDAHTKIMPNGDSALKYGLDANRKRVARLRTIRLRKKVSL